VDAALVELLGNAGDTVRLALAASPSLELEQIR